MRDGRSRPRCNPKISVTSRGRSADLARTYTFIRADEISADNPAKGESDRRRLFQRGMGINHRQNRPFASDGHTRASARRLDRRVLNGRDRGLADLSHRYLFALSSHFDLLLLRSLRSHFHFFIFIIFFFFRSIRARVSYGMVTRSCGRPQLRAGGHGAPAVFPTGKSAAIFHYPTRQCICLFRPPAASTSFPAAALTLEKVSCRYLCFDTGERRTSLAMIMFSLFTGLYGARWRKSGGTRYYAPLSAVSNR